MTRSLMTRLIRHVSVLLLARDKIFNAAETLAGMFGFQDDSVRNQVEHALTLLSNHRRYANENPSLLLGWVRGVGGPRGRTRSQVAAGVMDIGCLHPFFLCRFRGERGWCADGDGGKINVMMALVYRAGAFT